MGVAPTIGVLAFSIFGAVALGFIVLALSIWLWGAFLDIREHDPARVRARMFIILALATACELGFALQGFTHQWVAVVSLIVNVWGGVDALLRFPASHDFESFFAGKQFMLLMAKTFSYAFGIIGFRQHIGTFLNVLLLIIWGLPVLYLMALPLDPSEQVMKDEQDDVYIVV